MRKTNFRAIAVYGSLTLMAATAVGKLAYDTALHTGLDYLAPLKTPAQAVSESSDALRRYDSNGNGVLEVGELENFLRQHELVDRSKPFVVKPRPISL